MRDLEHCGECGTGLDPQGPSFFFCSPECQRTWQANAGRSTSEAYQIVQGRGIPRTRLQIANAERDRERLR